MANEKRLATIERKRKEKFKREHKLINGIDHKICNKHHIYFPEESPWIIATEEYFYHNDKNKTDYLHPECKRCGILKADQWIKDNPEKFKEAYKRYMKTDSWKAYKKQNFIRSKNKMREWRQKHPEKCRGYVLLHRNHDITEAEWRKCLEQFDYKCAYCGLTEKEHLEMYNQVLHREHADSGGANDLSNAIPSCGSCNYRKWIFPMEEWFREQDYFTEERLWYIYWWTTEGYKDYIDDKPPYRIVRKIDKETRKFHHELWSVDIHRNMIECIAIENKKKDIVNKLENGIIPMPIILPLSREDIV